MDYGKSFWNQEALNNLMEKLRNWI